MNWDIVVRRTGRTWSVIGISGGHATLLEGGFFRRGPAESCRAEWERQCLQEEMERAERKAGWDPHP